MQGWSLPLGRVFGVEVRLHSFFVFLLVPAMVWAASLGGTTLRGVALWLLVLLAVLVREAGRALAAAWNGIELERILLLPVGGLITYAPGRAADRRGEPGVQWMLALAGPLTSLVFGLTLAGLMLTVSPGVSLWTVRLVSPDHLLRAAVWVNLLLGAVNLLPSWPLDGGRLVQAELVRAGVGSAGVLRTLALVGPGLPWGLVALGFVLGNWWAVASGLAILAGAQAERQGANLAAGLGTGLGTGLAADSVGSGMGGATQAMGAAAGTGTVRVQDVMLTEYSVLQAGATLEDAVEQARQTLQDVFPVVRGGQMVGAAGRAEILQALSVDGNGYVQGIMTKTFQVASPEDALVETLSRVAGASGAGAMGSGSQLVPVVVGERVVGVVTPQNLQRAMSLLRRSRVVAERRER